MTRYPIKDRPERRIEIALNALGRGDKIRFVTGVSVEAILAVYRDKGYNFRIRVEPMLSACRVTRLRQEQVQ